MPLASTPSQTAWAMLALMAVGEVDSPAVRRGIDYLMRAPRRGREVAGEVVHGRGLPAHLLPALPRL